jgi:hypothetical protein
MKPARKWDEIEAGDCKELKKALAGWGLTAAQREAAKTAPPKTSTPRSLEEI